MIETNICSRYIVKHGSFIAVESSHIGFQKNFIGYCGDIPANRAELKGIEYFLKSIRKEFYNHELEINLGSGLYSKLMFDRAGSTWAKEPRQNAELIIELRELLSMFPGFNIRVLAPIKHLQQRLDDYIVQMKEKK